MMVSRSVRRERDPARDPGVPSDVGVDRNGSLDGVRGWVTTIINEENTDDTHRW